jgi:hypothetical protein
MHINIYMKDIDFFFQYWLDMFVVFQQAYIDCALFYEISSFEALMWICRSESDRCEIFEF